MNDCLEVVNTVFPIAGAMIIIGNVLFYIDFKRRLKKQREEYENK